MIYFQTSHAFFGALRKLMKHETKIGMLQFSIQPSLHLSILETNFIVPNAYRIVEYPKYILLVLVKQLAEQNHKVPKQEGNTSIEVHECKTCHQLKKGSCYTLFLGSLTIYFFFCGWCLKILAIANAKTSKINARQILVLWCKVMKI